MLYSLTCFCFNSYFIFTLPQCFTLNLPPAKAMAKGLMDEFTEHCIRNKPPGGAGVDAVPGLAKWLKAPPPGATLLDMPGFTDWLESQR